MKRRSRWIVAWGVLWVIVCAVTTGIGAAVGAGMGQGCAALGALTGLVMPHIAIGVLGASAAGIALLEWLQRWAERGD